MISTAEFCKKEYGQKLYKISFDAGMSCPNRDGTVSTGGCIFCSLGGSGDFSVDISKIRHISSYSFEDYSKMYINIDEDIEESIKKAKEKVSGKYKGDKFIAYFQAYTNTYAPVSELRAMYEYIIGREDIAVLSIATRPDCLNDEIYSLLYELNMRKPVWVELGLQTTKLESIEYINRGYENKIYDESVRRLKEIGIHVITHVILYLPGESIDDMISTVSHVVNNKSDGIKLQLLHILKDTKLGDEYRLFLEDEERFKVMRNGIGFYIPTLEEYADTLRKLVELLPEDMVVHRLTGDPPKKLLIEPLWSGDKKKVLNTINQVLNE